MVLGRLRCFWLRVLLHTAVMVLPLLTWPQWKAICPSIHSYGCLVDTKDPTFQILWSPPNMYIFMGQPRTQLPFAISGMALPSVSPPACATLCNLTQKSASLPWLQDQSWYMGFSLCHLQFPPTYTQQILIPGQNSAPESAGSLPICFSASVTYKATGPCHLRGRGAMVEAGGWKAERALCSGWTHSSRTHSFPDLGPVRKAKDTVFLTIGIQKLNRKLVRFHPSLTSWSCGYFSLLCFSSWGHSKRPSVV